jgi:outer membrane protein TolC
MSEAEREAFEAARLDVVRRVRDVWYELVWLRSAVLVTEGHRELIGVWEEVALSRYAAGEGGQADVIRAQVELGKIDNELQALSDLRRPIVARLNAALGRPAATPFPKVGDELPVLPAFDEAALVAALPGSSPVLRALARRVAAAEHGADLADKQAYPDFVLGLDYTFIGDAAMPGVSGSGDDALAVTLGLELPIYRDRIRAGIAQARAEHSAARGEAADAEHRPGAELELALYELRDAHRRVGLYRDTLVPKGEESLDAIAGAYRAGDAGFLDIIDAERVLLEFQLAEARAGTDLARSLARLEALTGTRLHEDPTP